MHQWMYRVPLCQIKTGALSLTTSHAEHRPSSTSRDRRAHTSSPAIPNKKEAAISAASSQSAARQVTNRRAYRARRRIERT